MAGLLQQFEPRGIGARNLRECLLLQLPRTGEAREVIDRFYDDFMHSRWNRIAERLQLTDEDIERIRREIGHLNPRPGSVLSEVAAPLPRRWCRAPRDDRYRRQPRGDTTPRRSARPAGQSGFCRDARHAPRRA